MARRGGRLDNHRRVGLAGHLLGLVLTVLVPSLALGGATAWHLAGLYRAASEARLNDTARALALAVDGELEIFQTAVLALASSPLLRLEDIRPFRAWAVTATTRLGGAVAVHEAAPGYPQLLNTLHPEGAAPRPAPTPPATADLVQRSLLTRQPTIANLLENPASDRPLAAAAAPTPDAQAVVAMAIPAERLARLLADQRPNGGAVVAIVDAQNRIVARSGEYGRLSGGDAAIVTVPLGSGTDTSGMFRVVAEDMPLLYAFRRLRRAPGWSVVVGEPLADYRTSWLRPLLVLLAGGGLALGLGLGLALALGRRIRSPVLALVRRADAAASGPAVAEPLALPQSSVAEFEELRQVMERADAALRAGEAEFRAAFEQSAVPMQQTDCATGCFLRVNRAFCQLLGRPAEQLIGLPFTEFTHPEDREVDLAGFWRMARGEVPSYEGEKRFVRPDGSVRWARIASSPVRDSQGHPVRTMAVVLDVTAQHEAEAARRSSEAWMRLAQEAGGIGSWDTNFETGTTRWSDENYRLWGLEPGTPIQEQFILSLVHPDDQRAMMRQQQVVLDPDGPHPVEVEFRIRRASDGAERRLLSVGERSYAADGHLIGHRGIIQDVTERRQAEEDLRRSEERLRLAQEAGGIGSWEWEVVTGALYWSESCHRLHGTDPAQPLTDAAWRELISEEDRLRVESMLDATLAGTATVWETEFRIVRPNDRAVRWINGRASVLRDPASGQAVRFIGVAIDVTERREAEERLRLLAREVDHRAKNALAVVQAALRLTPKNDAARYAQAVEGRVNNLARVHNLLAQARWSGTRLHQLAEGELAPFLPARTGGDVRAPRVVLDGAAVLLGPSAAQAISMALHELATNATKHGALSAPGGVVRLSWALDHPAGLLRIRWTETGGPPITAPPERRGFGSRVMEGTIRDQLGGAVRHDWTAAGLDCTLEVPLGRLASDLDEGASDRPLFAQIKD